MRERGLKLVLHPCSCNCVQSFPVRERGLKQLILCDLDSAHIVVPRAGTWIETQLIGLSVRFYIVVPRAGTWIETVKPAGSGRLNNASFPVRERGLKPYTAP